MELHWHRRDLRASDNRALAAAAEAGRVVPVFIFDPGVLDHAASARVAFMLESLAELRDWYRERDSDLVIATGKPSIEVPTLAREYDVDRVVWNTDYSGLAQERDEAVEAALNDAGFEVETFHDAVLHEPGSITTEEGEPYAVYSYFWRKWRDRAKPDPHPAPAPDKLACVTGEPLPVLSDLGFASPDADLLAGGMSAARERLESFSDGPIYRYERDRDTPHTEATSRLSAHLKWGTVGIRMVYDTVKRAESAAPDTDGEGSCETFASQLAWREFYTHVLDANPAVVSEDYRPYENPIEWREDPEALAAWKRGETGYPFVDAGMRQLLSEAFMHNRLRMVVASFLTKDLLIDWREGYDWFREKLVDHDTANDAGGWQWAASTGTDAQPYFRIFNPVTQGERHDPEARYIRRYVPELRDVSTVDIHGWTELDPEDRDSIAPSYPAPIVDHARRREAALEMFEAARGDG